MVRPVEKGSNVDETASLLSPINGSLFDIEKGALRVGDKMIPFALYFGEGTPLPEHKIVLVSQLEAVNRQIAVSLMDRIWQVRDKRDGLMRAVKSKMAETPLQERALRRCQENWQKAHDNIETLIPEYRETVDRLREHASNLALAERNCRNKEWHWEKAVKDYDKGSKALDKDIQNLKEKEETLKEQQKNIEEKTDRYNLLSHKLHTWAEEHRKRGMFPSWIFRIPLLLGEIFFLCCVDSVYFTFRVIKKCLFCFKCC